MSTPTEDVDAQDKNVQKSEPTFSDAVNKALEGMTKDEKGVWKLPEGLDPNEPVGFAAMAEKRRRDTQAGFTQLTQKNKALEAEKAALLNKATGSVEVQLTEAQAEELEALKFSDPDAWRKKLNVYEAEARTKRAKEIDDELKQVSTSTLDSEELERRKSVLEKFNQEHPDLVINDDLIESEIPPRITKKLADGKVTFEEFLEECYEYAKTGKVVASDKVLNQPNLSKVGGGNSPDKNAAKEDIILSYQKETY